MADLESIKAKITDCIDANLVRRWLAAGIREKNEQIEVTARRRLAELAPSAPDNAVAGSLEHDFWSMVDTVEQIRRDRGRTVWRMNRLRPIAEHQGVLEALARCIQEETPGFREILDYDLPELTAEAIALRHGEQFSPELLIIARNRLTDAGVTAAI